MDPANKWKIFATLAAFQGDAVKDMTDDVKISEPRTQTTKASEAPNLALEPGSAVPQGDTVVLPVSDARDQGKPGTRINRKERLAMLPSKIKELDENNFPLEAATQELVTSPTEKKCTQLNRTGLIEDIELRKLLSKYCIENGCEPSTALLALTQLFYKGMSAENFNEKESVEVEGKKYTVKNFNTVKGRAGLKSVKNRQIARTLAPQMLEIAIRYNIDGQLCSAIEKYEAIADADRPKLCDFYGANLVGRPVKKMIEGHLERARKRRRGSNNAKKRRPGKGGRD